MKFFHPENPVFAFISRIGDMLVLSLLWFFASLPVITCGAASAALFDCCMKIIRGRDSNTVKDFFHSFKVNFRQATVIFLIMAAAGGVTAADMYFWAHSDSPAAAVMNAVSIGLAVLYFLTLMYVFPVQATFENRIKDTLRTAFLMSLKHWKTSAGLLSGAAALSYICFKYPAAAYVFLIIGTGVFGMIYSLSFVSIFKLYNSVIAEDMAGKQWDKEDKKTEVDNNSAAVKKKNGKHKGKIIS